MGAEKEEREKKALAKKMIEKEQRREERENFEKSLMKELIGMRKTLETVKEEEEKLRLEVEELKKSNKEDKIVRVIVEIRNGDDKMKEVDISQVSSGVISTVPTQVTVPSPNP